MILPPGLMQGRVFSRMLSWSSLSWVKFSGVILQRASMRFLRTPVLEQGTSRRMPSKWLCHFCGAGSVQSKTSVSAIFTLRLSRFSRRRGMRLGLESVQSRVPLLDMAAAIWVDFPPGAAQASRMVSPGCGARRFTACWVAGSWM